MNLMKILKVDLPFDPYSYTRLAYKILQIDNFIFS